MGVHVRIILVLAAALAPAQTPGSPAFEVATIKLAAPMGMGRMMIGTRGGPGTQDPGRFTCNNCNLSMLISTAYDINYVQISGPSWLDSQRFDVVAKVPQGATKEQFRVMMQNLLIERFKLAAHHDKKDLPTYELSVAKNGPKLKDSPGPPDSPGPEGRGRGGPMPPPRSPDGAMQLPNGRFSIMMMSPRGSQWRVVDESMEQFAKSLQGMVGRPVNDATGLKGKYDFELTFSGSGSGMLLGRGMMPGGPPPPPPGGPGGPGAPVEISPDDSGPTIFTALQEQLGLKLDAKKGPVEIVVIDHIEKTPTEN